MKRYELKNCKYILAVVLLGAALLLTGVLLAIFNDALLKLKLCLFSGGFSAIMIFLPVYFAEHSRWLGITEKSVMFPRGVTVRESGSNPKSYLKRLTVDIGQIRFIKKELVKGDKIIVLDTYFYDFVMRDGKTYSLPLYPYGKKNTDAIINALRKLGVQVRY